MTTIAVLFAARDSIYKTIPACDVWDAERDATRWPGGAPIIAHPPCRAWSRLRHFAKPPPGEAELAPWAIDQVRKWGGVLEHPRCSTLWPHLGLPMPGARHDRFGGFTLGIHQHCLGHRAEKATLLYIVGVAPRDLPPLPLDLSYPLYVITSSRRRPDGTRDHTRPDLSRRERAATPPAFAAWLVQLASAVR